MAVLKALTAPTGGHKQALLTRRTTTLAQLTGVTPSLSKIRPETAPKPEPVVCRAGRKVGENSGVGCSVETAILSSSSKVCTHSPLEKNGVKSLPLPPPPNKKG